MTFRRLGLAVGICTVTCSTAMAHPHPDHLLTDGLTAGFAHPWLGLDHLLAMIAFGFLAAQLGGRALWLLPSAFLGMTIVGGAAVLSGLEFPLLPHGVAFSVVALGVALAVGRKYPQWAAVMAMGCFGLFHGYAHGPEIAASTSPALYAAGFLLATMLLYSVGIASGFAIVHKSQRPTALRLTGAALSLVGVVMLLGVAG